MEDNEKYFGRAIKILFELKEREYRKTLYKVASVSPRALVEAVDGRNETDVVVARDPGNRQVIGTCEEHAKQFTETVEAVVDERPIVEKLVDAGCTTKQIADATGVVFGTVGKWKRGEKRPSRRHSQQLQALLEKVI